MIIILILIVVEMVSFREGVGLCSKFLVPDKTEKEILFFFLLGNSMFFDHGSSYNYGSRKDTGEDLEGRFSSTTILHLCSGSSITPGHFSPCPTGVSLLGAILSSICTTYAIRSKWKMVTVVTIRCFMCWWDNINHRTVKTSPTRIWNLT